MPFDDPSLRVEMPPRYAAELDLVDRIAAKLKTRGDWCKWRMTTRKGAHCIMAAAHIATQETLAATKSGRDVVVSLSAVNRVTGRLHDLAGGNVVRFNDSIFTTHKRVLRLLKAVRKSFE